MPDAVAQRLIDGLSQADPDILGRMMPVNVQVARARDRQVHERMPGKQLEHVVEKTDPRGNPRLPFAIQVEPQADISLASRSSDFGDSWRGTQFQGPRRSGSLAR